MGKPNKTDINNFWSKVLKTDTCWLWQGCKAHFGYGQLTFKQKRHRTHRFSWELHHGNIPNGLCVLHKCDNPACVNPEHLFLGTRKDNIEDMIAKGRGALQQRTHCTRGHEYTKETSYLYKRRKDCRKCKVIRNQEYRLRLRNNLKMNNTQS